MLPFMNPTNKKSKKYVVAFKGLNYGEGYEDGEFSDAKNISLDEFPCLTQRSGRLDDSYFELTNATNFLAKNGLYVVDGTNLVYEGSVVVEGLLKKVSIKKVACIGNYIVFFPDKVYYNVATGEHGNMDIEFNANATFTASTIEIEEGTFPFSKGDTVEIIDTVNKKSATIREYLPQKLTFDANTFTATTGDVARDITIKRTVPELDYICESNYRLWGVKDNTIYGSKYMDPLNFQSFDGSSGDSYAIDVATDGEFTGCIPYTSHICFFKENVLHKLYGSKPSNFQLVTSQVNGVQDGSERSMCIVNETLYYKGVDGVYAYTGGAPTLVSKNFGTRRFQDAIATSDGAKYYIAMGTEDVNAKCVLYTYEIGKGLWSKEDDMPWGDRYMDIGCSDGKVVLLSKNKLSYIVQGERIDITADGDELPIDWSVTFCPFNEVMNERKGYSKFHMRLDLSEGASLKVEIKRNIDTQWQTVYTTHNERAQTVTVPILPARCDSVEIRLSGKGVCKLRTFIREFYVGSDV